MVKKKQSKKYDFIRIEKYENLEKQLLVKKWIVLTDCHLIDHDQIKSFQLFLNYVDWDKFTGLIILGDFFHVWCVEKKFWTDDQREVMDKISRIKKKYGIRILFFIGNREVTRSNRFSFPTEYTDETIWNPSLFLNGNGNRIFLCHGDLINYRDIDYLRWKKIFRSSPFQFLIRIIPYRWLSFLMFSIEKKVLEATINNPVRRNRTLPEEIFEDYANWIDGTLGSGSKLLALAGHIHPPEIMEKSVDQSHVVILKAWADGQKYYEFDFDQLTFEEREFNE